MNAQLNNEWRVIFSIVGNCLRNWEYICNALHMYFSIYSYVFPLRGQCFHRSYIHITAHNNNKKSFYFKLVIISILPHHQLQFKSPGQSYCL